MSPGAVRPWIILALIFLLGAATGSLLTIGFGPHFSGPPGAHEMGNRWMMMRLTHRLNLTDDQQAKIEPIITKAEGAIQSIQHDDLAHISSILKEVNAGIAPYLNPAQLTELQKMDKEREEHERMFLHHQHGPGAGHGPDDFHHPGPDDHPAGAPVEPAPPAPTS